jgi:hypothetical protein
VDLKEQLQAEFTKRRRRNPQYSLRAFARDLATNHASLSQLLHGRRFASAQMAHALGRRAGMNPNEIARCCNDGIDRSVLQAIGSRSFRPATRWIAIHTGISVDAVNCSLVRLLQRGAVVMESPQTWRIHK